MPDTKTGALPDGVRVAETFLENHNYDEAEKYFHAVLSKDGNQARALNGLGICYQERDRNLDRAVSFFRNAVQVDPSYLKARKNLIIALLEHNLPYVAMDEYVAGIKHDPKNGRMRLEYADILATKLRFPEVLKQVREALVSAVAAKDEALFNECQQFLRQLKLPQANKLAAEFEPQRPQKPSDSSFLMKVGAGVAAGVLAVSVYLQTRPVQKAGPEILCARYSAGASLDGLAAAAREVHIARAAIYEPGGRLLFDKTLADMTAEDWARFEQLLKEPEGRAVFGSPPSISLNRWCTVNFAAGKVAHSVSLSHAP